MNSLSYYTGLARESIAQDKEKIDLYAEIDKHRLGQWDTPAALKALPWIKDRKFASTIPADSISAAERTFATFFPKLEVAPLSEEVEEYERVERLEQALSWHYKRMNADGKKTTHWRIVESAMRYGAVAFQTEYLPFAFKGQEKDKRIKAMLRQCSYRWPVHHPATVHARYSKYGLECVTLATVRSAKQIVEEFGKDLPGVKKMLKNIKDSDNAETLMSTYFTLYDVTDWENRVQWITDNAGSEKVNTDVDEGIELRREEHKLPFIPWVVTDNEEPLLKNAIQTGLLDNLNILQTIDFSKTVTMVANPNLIITTPDGTLSGVYISNDDPNQPLVKNPSVTVEPTRPSQIDPQLAVMLNNIRNEVHATTVAQILADANALTSTESFSAANLRYKAAVTQLSLAKDAAKRAIEQGFYQCFQWIDYAGDKPLISFREKTRNVMDKQREAGEELSIQKGDFDLEHLYINVELQENSITDEQAQTNLAVMRVERLGTSRELEVEKLGIDNYSLHQQKAAEEALLQASIQTDVQTMLGQAQAQIQLMMQQAQMQMQTQMQQAMQAQQQAQQLQPEQQVQDMNAGEQFAMAQGMDGRGGGFAPQGAAPGQGREQINGAAASGEPLA